MLSSPKKQRRPAHPKISPPIRHLYTHTTHTATKLYIYFLDNHIETEPPLCGDRQETAIGTVPFRFEFERLDFHNQELVSASV